MLAVKTEHFCVNLQAQISLGCHLKPVFVHSQGQKVSAVTLQRTWPAALPNLGRIVAILDEKMLVYNSKIQRKDARRW